MRAKRICHAAGLLKKLDCKKMCRESSQGWQSQSTLGTTTLWVEWFSSRSGCLFFIFYTSNHLECRWAQKVTATPTTWSPQPPTHATESTTKSHHALAIAHVVVAPIWAIWIILDFQWPHGRAMEAALLEWVNALGVPCFRDGSWDGFCVELKVTAKEMRWICTMRDKLQSQACRKNWLSKYTID